MSGVCIYAIGIGLSVTINFHCKNEHRLKTNSSVELL